MTAPGHFRKAAVRLRGLHYPRERTSAKGEVTASLDHLIGATEQRERDRAAERLRGLEIDDQLLVDPA
jgi:hypothetical protein